MVNTQQLQRELAFFNLSFQLVCQSHSLLTFITNSFFLSLHLLFKEWFLDSKNWVLYLFESIGPFLLLWVFFIKRKQISLGSFFFFFLLRGGN